MTGLPRARLHGRRGDPHVRGFGRQVPRPQRAARAGGEVARGRAWSSANSGARRGRRGCSGSACPRPMAAPGGDFRHDVVVAEPIIRKGVEGFAAGLHNVIITPYIQAHGTEGQKQQMAAQARQRRAGRGDRDERAGRGLRPAIGPHHRAPGRQRLPDQRRQDLHLQRPDRRPDRRRRQDRPEARAPRASPCSWSSPTRSRASAAAGSSTRSGSTRRTRPNCSSTTSGCRPTICSATEEGKGFYQLMARAAARAPADRDRQRGGDGEGARGDDRLRQGAQGVRQADLRLPEQPVRARRLQGQGGGRAGVRQRLHRAAAARRARRHHRRRSPSSG